MSKFVIDLKLLKDNSFMSNEYALFNTFRNRFIMVNSDYESLKYLQLITMNHELLYLVDLNGIVNYRPNLLNNDRCMNVTIANGEKIRIEIDMYFTNPSYRLVPARTKFTQDDIEYKEKMHFLFDFIQKSRDHNYHILDRDLRQVETLKKGLRVFKKFISLTVPNDVAVQEFVDREIINKDVPKKILEEFQGILFRILSDLDYSRPLNEIKADIEKKIRLIPISAYYFTESINKSIELLKNEPC